MWLQTGPQNTIQSQFCDNTILAKKEKQMIDVKPVEKKTNWKIPETHSY